MGNPLRTLLDLPEKERAERGLEHTPREIWQQPDTWKTTYEICSSHRKELNDAVRRAGIGRGSTAWRSGLDCLPYPSPRPELKRRASDIA